ncbi:MAG: hypothetical protein GXP19_03725, partial [Gammaproteobacteria bacterium]|nr:hypothetical protein [Gammaproteobacteria bacterium]
FNVFTEFVASDQFNAAEIDFNGVGAEPSAYNIEFGYFFGESTVALAFTGTAEALDSPWIYLKRV